MENISAPQAGQGAAMVWVQSLIFLAADHFVTRVDSSHIYQLTDHVIAKHQTLEGDRKLVQYLAKQIVKVRMI